MLHLKLVADEESELDAFGFAEGANDALSKLPSRLGPGRLNPTKLRVKRRH
jgi:hypothetical protein